MSFLGSSRTTVTAVGLLLALALTGPGTASAVTASTGRPGASPAANDGEIVNARLMDPTSVPGRE